ncbi:MAG TPA: CARDB domain-containing protein, partial [Polyangiaceae bacterium]|nr:CARDB domain-containing protein [Polyangiaceae bacterium]
RVRVAGPGGALGPIWTRVQGSDSTAMPNVGIGGIARDPDDPTNTWYVGTEVGVFYTQNAGSTWSNATAPLGLPNVAIGWSIEVNPVTRYLTVGTFGRGIWRIPLSGGTLPDLIVSTSPAPTMSPSNTPARGQVVSFKATIRNQGAVATPNLTNYRVTFSIDGSVKSTWTGGSALGASSTLAVTGTGTWTATRGSHTLLVRVDDTGLANHVAEGNEGNNTYSRTFSVP